MAISALTVIREAPWQIVIFSLGMYLVVYGPRNGGLTGQLTNHLDIFASYDAWNAAFGTGFLPLSCLLL